MATLTPTQLSQLRIAIKQLADRQHINSRGQAGSRAQAGKKLSNRQFQALEFDKWRQIHKYIHAAPFKTRQHIKRSQQWHEALTQVRNLGEIEVLDWVLLQAQVAGNLERGIQDMRPRKNGPCHTLLLEYVADRKRKAHAILNFAIASQAKGSYTVNSTFHEETEAILQRGASGYRAHDEGHETLPWPVQNEDNEDSGDKPK